MSKKSIASVILDTAIVKPLDYSIPKEFENTIRIGQRVEVPLRNASKKGFIFSLKTRSNVPYLIKPIKKIISNETLPPEFFSLAEWIAKYYCVSLSRTIRSMIPPSIRKEAKEKSLIFLSSKKTKKELLSLCSQLQGKFPAQATILEAFLSTKKGLFLHDLMKILKISKSPFDSLIKKNILLSKKLVSEDTDLLLHEDFFPTLPKKLNEEQQKALNSIEKSIAQGGYCTHLIHGVTASGKTEIYLQSIEKTRQKNKSSLFLVPEIALTSQTIEKLKSRFKEKIAILHHRRSAGQRYASWIDVLKGKAKIIIGARSAIFAPTKDLGLIIVDEEHDFSYKQTEESPSYHARNIALMRGKLANCTVLLGSATPSLESYYNAIEGKYILHTIKKRPTRFPLPLVHIVDMKKNLQKNKNFTHFSDKLMSAMKDRYEKGEQTLLFLNRRGYHSHLFCKKCSHIIKCPHCDLSLTYHKQQHLLKCHFCSFTLFPPKTCQKCGEEEHMQYKGYGTEHVERSLHYFLPSLRTLRIDRDTTGQKDSHEKLFKQFRAGKADVLIGTQMIVKGLHFPAVTLVGVLNTDGALNIPDFRSTETVFQLITQVAGRAGRADIKGEVIIQTFLPKDDTIHLSAKQDYLAFYEKEINNRKTFNFPPFSRLIKLIFSGKDERKTEFLAKKFRKTLIQYLPSSIKIYPIIPSAHAKIKDRYRFHFLLKTKKILPVISAIDKVKKEVFIKDPFRLFIDVDTHSTFF